MEVQEFPQLSINHGLGLKVIPVDGCSVRPVQEDRIRAQNPIYLVVRVKIAELDAPEVLGLVP